MTPGWWTELAATQRIADLRREAAHERPEYLTQRGDRS